MLEDKRMCPGCGKIIAWGEPCIICSDNRMLCTDCCLRANVPAPTTARQHTFPSSIFVDRVRTHEKYDAFCKKNGTVKKLDGYLLINENDMTFAVGSDNYAKMQLGFQSGHLNGIDSISINDGVQTKSVKVSDGDSGAAGALFGGLFFGPLGALVGGLGTRTGSEYGEITGTNNVGFTITNDNTSHEVFNVLELCLNYNYVNYQEEREVFEEAKQITINICEELLKCVDKLRPKSPVQNAHPQAQSPAVTSGININPSNIEPTITRIEMFMEDGEWDTAKAYVNAALDYFPTDHRLYLLALCIDVKAETVDGLNRCNQSFRDNSNYKRFTRFADAATISKLEEILTGIEEKAEKIQIREAAEKAAIQAQQEEKERQEKEQLKKKQEEIVRNIEEQKSSFYGLIERRKELISLIENGVQNDSALVQLEEIESELLKNAGIVSTSDNSFSFEEFNKHRCSMTVGNSRQLLFNGNNEWFIIGRTEDKILLLSKYGEKDSVAFSNLKECDWDHSALKRSLTTRYQVSQSSTFIPLIEAFSRNHKEMIGELFILSSDEVTRYLPDKESRILYDKGNATNRREWFLRDGVKSNMVTIVNRNGDIVKVKNHSLMSDYLCANRPAIWIDINIIKEFVEKKAKIEIINNEQNTDVLLADGNTYSFFGHSIMTPKRFSSSVEIGNFQFLIKHPEQEGTILIINSPNDCISKDVAISEAGKISSRFIGNNKLIEEQAFDIPIGSCFMYVIDEASQNKILIQGILYDEINNQIMTIGLYYNEGTEPDQIVEEFISMMKSVRAVS